MLGTIRKIVELWLSRESARRMEAEAQRALDRATDPTKSQRNLADIDRAFGGLRKTVVSIGATIAAAFAISRLKDFAVRLFQVGSAAQETQSKFNTVFGREGAAMVQDFIDRFGVMMGLNQTAAQDFTATAGAIVQGMGASQEASARFATEIVKLAGDLTSFHNIPIQETFAALRSGLTGEYEPLKRFGIVVDQDTVKLRALIETGKRHKEELTLLEIAQARYNLIVERAGVALGDLERTQGSSANQVRALRAEYENLEIEVGTKLLPVFAGLIDYTNQNKQGFKDFLTTLVQVGIFTGGVVYNSLASLADIIAGSLSVAVGQAELHFWGLRSAIAGAQLGWLKFRRVIGQEDAGAEAEAAAEVARAVQNMQEARNRVRGGLALLESGGRGIYNLTYVRSLLQAINAAAEQNLTWSPDRRTPDTPTATGSESDAERKRREREEAERRKRETERGIARERSLDTPQNSRDAGEEAREDARRRAESERITNPQVDTRRDPISVMLEAREAALTAFTDNWLNSHQSIIGVAQGAADNIVSAWEDAFTLLLTDAGSLRQAFEGIGRGIAGALIGGLADLARSKVSENIAHAAEQIAKSFGFAALGPAGAFQASQARRSAAAHILAAAKWAVVGGVAGAAASAAGGHGGASGGGRGGASFDNRRVEEANRPERHVTVILRGDFDALNVRVQDVVHRAVDLGSERRGVPASIKATILREGRR